MQKHLFHFFLNTSIKIINPFIDKNTYKIIYLKESTESVGY